MFGTYLKLTATVGLILLSLPTGNAQEINAIPFDTVPEGTQAISNPIVLGGPTEVTSSFSSESSIESKSIGYIFPDGSLQSTAATQQPDSGLYSNRILDFTPPLPYSEICFRDGTMAVDVHTVVEPPAGGSCEPGDIGWIIERDERNATGVTWTEARADCLKDGMRLPEVFEYQLSCMNDTAFGLSAMQDDFEWATNNPIGIFYGSWAGVCAISMGGGGCTFISTHVVGQWDGGVDYYLYRCAR